MKSSAVPVAAVLLVDNEEAHVELLTHAFAGHADRFSLTVSASVAAARALAATARPDLILADLHLPDGAGTELLDLDVPVVIMTSRGDERIAVRTLKAGAMDYVVKSPASFRVMPHIAERALQAWDNLVERLRAEDELRRSEERLAEAQRVARIGSWEWDPERGAIWGTDEARRIFGIADASAVRTIDDLWQHVLDADRERMRHAITGAVDRDEPIDETCRIARRDGAIRVVQVTGQVVAREHRRVLGTVQDVTERKRLEQEFLQAQKLEAIGLLASGVAHDINNLLMGIRGCLDVALSRLGDADSARHYVVEARAATESGADVTSQLLMFSRKRDEPPRRLLVDSLVSDTRQMIGRLLGADIQLSVALDAAEACVLCEPGRLQQVLMNLVVNARDAMATGGALAISTASVTVDRTTYVRLTVSDTGCGMSEATRTRVFEPFFTTKPIGEGTGLGLSTTYAIVKRAGGFIELDSELGVGTEVRIFLPRSEAEADAAQLRQAIPEPTTDRETVLVIEDERLVRLAVRHYLESAGYAVLVAGTVAEGKELVRDHLDAIDLMITDVVLPDGIGIEVTSLARELKPQVPVICMSAYSDDILESRYGFAQGAPRLHKPFAREQLLAKVRDVILRRADDTVPNERPTILLVEDHATARHAAQILLDDLGYRVLEAATGAAARALFAEHDGRIDVVITDLGLPDATGDDLVRELRTQRPSLPAIYVSGRALDDATVRALLADPSTAYLQKPVDFDDIARAVRILLG